MKQTPQSVVAQTVGLISSIGGWLSIATTFWFCLFTRKYPPSQEELISSRLSFPWHASSQREIPGSFLEMNTQAASTREE